MISLPSVDVLLIDDDADMRDALAEILREEGFSVAAAAHGLEALEYLDKAESKPALIVLDLMMPRMDGFELRKRLLASPEHAVIPVAIMTANSRVMIEVLSPLPLAVIRKPFKIEVLLDLLSRLGVRPRG